MNYMVTETLINPPFPVAMIYINRGNDLSTKDFVERNRERLISFEQVDMGNNSNELVSELIKGLLSQRGGTAVIMPDYMNETTKKEELSEKDVIKILIMRLLEQKSFQTILDSIDGKITPAGLQKVVEDYQQSFGFFAISERLHNGVKDILLKDGYMMPEDYYGLFEMVIHYAKEHNVSTENDFCILYRDFFDIHGKYCNEMFLLLEDM